MDTVFLCFHVRSLDPARFVDAATRKPALAATMPPGKMREVDDALRRVLDLSPSSLR